MSRPSSGAPWSHVARTSAGSAMQYASTSRRATSHEPRGSGWLIASACQPRAGVYSSTGCGSKFSPFSRRPRSRRSVLFDTARADLDAAGEAAARQLGDALDGRRPHVQLDLLAHPQLIEQEVGEPVAGARPRLDRELEELAVARLEADLAGLEMPLERHEAERLRRLLDHAHRAVPRPRHAHDVLVADLHPALLAAHLGEARELARGDEVEVVADLFHQLARAQLGLADAAAVAAAEERARAGGRVEHLVEPRIARGIGGPVGPPRAPRPPAGPPAR